METLYVWHPASTDELVFARDAFAKSNAYPWFGAQWGPDPRNPETPVATEKQRAKLLALAGLLIDVCQAVSLRTLDGTMAGLVLTAEKRPVWHYVKYSFRGLGAEAEVARFVREHYGEGATFVFQR